MNQNHSGYSGAGFVDKLEAAGAGVTFYAKVANAGDYDVTFRYANGDAAERSLSVYVNGAYIGKTIMPSTGHWDTWADCLMQLPLAAGNNIITLKHEDASGDTGYVNLDSCTVPFYPEVITAEAENAALYGTAGTNQDHWNYSGSGFVDGMTSAGAGAEFEITVPKDGSYEASIRYCNGTQATKDLNLYVNGSYIETISFGSIGGNWNEWQELTQTLELDEGRNVVALRYDSSNSGNVNLDKLSVKTEPDATISVPLVDNGGFERDTSQSSAWTEWHPDGQAVAYGVDSGSGTNPPESPYAGDKRAYFYSGSAYQQSIHQGINLPNGTYTVQAWIKVSNTAPDIGRMEVTGYGGDSIYVDMPYAGTGWRLVETDITVTTGYLDIGFYCSSLGGTTVHIDNVKILNK
ncbi:MAG: CBM35 domain-containing protein [Flavonifractor plautii]